MNYTTLADLLLLIFSDTVVFHIYHRGLGEKLAGEHGESPPRHIQGEDIDQKLGSVFALIKFVQRYPLHSKPDSAAKATI